MLFRYFSLPRVLDGLFKLANKVRTGTAYSHTLHLTALAQLFGIDVVPATGIDAPKWHDDVQVSALCSACFTRLLLSLLQFWQINRDGAAVAYFYLDPYSRPHEKRQVFSRNQYQLLVAFTTFTRS